MYVYVQGRRLARRRAAGPDQRIDDAHVLVDRSLALCEGAERKLLGFERALPRALEHPAANEYEPVRPFTARPHASARAHSFGLLRPSTGARPGLRGGAPFPFPDSCAQPARLEDEAKPAFDAEELVRILEERERALLGRTEQLERKVQWLDQQLAVERKEKRQLGHQVKQSEAIAHANALHATPASVRRRYHFAVVGNELGSTLSSKTNEMRFFEVVVERDRKTPVTTEAAENDEEITRFRRFAYSERPYEIFAGGTDETRMAAADGVASATKFLDARMEVKWDHSHVTELERRVGELEAELREAQSLIKEYDARKHDEILLKQQEWQRELAQAKAEFRERFRACVKKLTPLALKNGMLQSRVQEFKRRWRDAIDEIPAQVILRWNTNQRVEALKTLLEMDKVNFFLEDDFAATLKFSEPSMVRWCKLFIHHLEVKYSGTATMLQMICDIFDASKLTLARKVVAWYNSAESRLEDETIAALSSDAVQGTENSEIFLMRNDLLEGVRDIWDIAAQLLQVPKANAMADLLGFTPEDEEMILQHWPSFLAYFYSKQTCEHLLDPHPPPLTSAWARLKQDCLLWPEVERRATIAKYGLFDVDILPPVQPMDLAEVSVFVVDMYTRRAREEDAELAAANLPQYLRHTMVKMREPRSLVHKLSARLQTAVRICQQGNTRVRVFAKLAGMTKTPLEDFYPCAERFAMTFWRLLIEMDTDGSMSLRDLARWLSGEQHAPSTDKHFANHAAKASTMGRGDRAVAAGQVAKACVAAAQKHLIIPPETAQAFGQLPSVADVCTLLRPAHVAANRGSPLPLKDLEKQVGETATQDCLENAAASEASASVSFDLATGIALDLWYRLLRQYQAHVAELWGAHEQAWESGRNLSSPDLSQLRLFLAQACNLAFDEEHLTQLFLDMSSYDDTIDMQHGVDCIARHLHQARALRVQ